MRTDTLDAKLLQLTPLDAWDVRTALTHMLVLGTTGSGKSSAPLKHCIKSFLLQGFGALFCVAKPEDAEAIIAYCRETGRLGSLLNWDGTNGGYNFLAHELARSGNINNVIDVLMAVLEMIRSSGSTPGKSGEQFWTDSVQQMLRATIPVIYAATGSVRISDILAFIRSAPFRRSRCGMRRGSARRLSSACSSPRPSGWRPGRCPVSMMRPASAP
jgi:hypothetical protein